MKKIITLSLCLFSMSALATPVEELEHFIAQARYIKADFTQTSIGESGEAEQVSKGVFYLQQPSQFRWDYQQPFKQQIIAKGDKIWFYDEDLEQVIIKNLDASIGDTPALLLSGQVNLSEKFTITAEDTQDNGVTWLKLTPKNLESNFKYILVGLKNKLLQGMVLSDNFGQLTEILFDNLSLPKKLEENLFEFVAPEGTDVFEG